MLTTTRCFKVGFRLVIFCAALAAGHPLLAAPDRQDITTLPPAEITALQTRLKDDGCYAGLIDGQANAATKAAVDACPDQRPQLRIETGMHLAVINSIGVNAACSVAATASDDKTVRLWSLPDGKLLRTLRLSIGSGDGGKAYTTAVSPDGHFVAIGGWDAGYDGTPSTRVALTIFDAASGLVVARVGGFENVVLQLTFSADGRWLAATLGSNGMRVIDTLTWRVVAADESYSDASSGAVFAPDGRLYTTSQDGKLRRYGPAPRFTKESEVAIAGGKQPSSVAVDPGGTRLAVAFNTSAAVALYDAPTLRLRQPAETQGIANGSLNSVAWSRDGRTLIAGGRYKKSGTNLALLFNRGSQRLGTAPLASNTITNLQACGAGFAAAAADPAFGLVAADGRKDLWREGVAADMRDKRGQTAFTLSADARRVRFGLGQGAVTPVSFDVVQAALTDSPNVEDGLAPPRTDGLPVTDWTNYTKPLFDGRPIALDHFETSRSLAIRPGSDGFVLGTDYWVRAFDGHGSERWRTGVPAVARGLNLSADGRVIVAAYGDGTIRWHRWSDGQELLALFVNKQNRMWVAWTPTGYYMASPGGEDMIGWHVNRGWAQVADFFLASKFRDQFSRPDIVEKVLDTLDEGEAIKQADAARGGKVAPVRPLLERLPPVITILSPASGASVVDDVQVEYLVRSPSNLPVDGIEALIDGRPLSGSRGLARVSTEDALRKCLVETHGAGRSEGSLQGCRGSLVIHVPSGAREIGLFARSGDRVSDVGKIAIVRAAVPASDLAARQPNLYALVVGISEYANPSYTLQFAAKDARDFAAALDYQKGGFYGTVTVRLLADKNASATSIKDGLDWLTKQVTDHDVGLVYLAGHGVIDERDRFYFVAADSDADRIRATGVPREDIQDALDALPGKALLFLDACHAGAVGASKLRGQKIDINGVANAFTQAEHGVVMFTASTGRQESQENAEWGNGAFTKAVIEGLGAPGGHGKADFMGKGTITTSALDTYVSARVKDLTGGGQSPVMIRPATVPDFPLAVAR